MNSYKQKLLDPRWQRKRLEVMGRDNFTCQCCGDNESVLNIHHLYYSGEPWDVENYYLITVCHVCHKEIEILKLDECDEYVQRLIKIQIKKQYGTAN